MMERDKNLPDQDPDATINEIPNFDADATVTDTNPFDPNATIEHTHGGDPNATVQDAGRVVRRETDQVEHRLDADARLSRQADLIRTRLLRMQLLSPRCDHRGNGTVRRRTDQSQNREFDPNATLEETDHFDANADANATVEVGGDERFDADATIEHTGDFDPNATMASSGDFSIDLGESPGGSGEDGGSVLEDSKPRPDHQPSGPLLCRSEVLG